MRPIDSGGWARWALWASSLLLVGACWYLSVSAIPRGSGAEGAPELARRETLAMATGFAVGTIFSLVMAFLLTRPVVSHRPPDLVPESRRVHPPSDSEVTDLLSRAASRLGSSGLLVTWRLRHEGGRPCVEAMITNTRSTANATLGGDDLRSEPAVRYKLLDAWSEVLKEESHRLIGGPTKIGEPHRP